MFFPIVFIQAKRNSKIEQVEKKFANGEITSFKRDDLLKVNDCCCCCCFVLIFFFKCFCYQEMKKHYEEKIVSIDMHLLNLVDKNVYK